MPSAAPSATTFDPEMILLRGGVVQCKQCFGDLVRLDGVLRCGTCGLPESEQLQKDTTFRPPGPLERAVSENDRLRKENAEQRELIASLRTQPEPAINLTPVETEPLLKRRK